MFYLFLFFSGDFLPNEVSFKMAKDKCFWGFFYSPNIEKEIYKIESQDLCTKL